VLNNYFDKISISGYFITVTDHLPAVEQGFREEEEQGRRPAHPEHDAGLEDGGERRVAANRRRWSFGRLRGIGDGDDD
jgi:hypothetical protein